MHVHTHGDSGPTVIVLHGGPGAPGSAAALARRLGDSFRVLEPWQRGSGDAPLTVARHVADLHELVTRTGGRPALVGSSWGAMLALAYAAEHPDTAGPLVLVGCGTFDLEARARLQQTLADRTDDSLRACLARIAEQYPDPAEQMVKRHEVSKRLYAFEPLPPHPLADDPPFDLRAHEETWADMIRLQAEGVYPGAFRAIAAPVLMLHGAYDPHPGAMIRDSLLPHIPQLEYREWERCGHAPWLERHVCEEFLEALTHWLTERSAGG